ncbi:hypothetical protein G7046_g8953 [Stylonectria norvegica]|nr:hypothetical protein G7046_g8953 [Stylonectria norvegica]
MATSQSPAFQKAVADSKKLTSKPSNEDLLELYGTSSPFPPLLPLSRSLIHRSPLQGRHRRGHLQGSRARHGKAKKNAWQKVVDDGATPDLAQEKYIALVERLKEQHGYDENKEPEAVGA